MSGPDGHSSYLVFGTFGQYLYKKQFRSKIIWEIVKHIMEAFAYASEVDVVHGGA